MHDSVGRFATDGERLEASLEPMPTRRALRAGRALTAIEPTSDALCRVSNTARLAPGQQAAGAHVLANVRHRDSKRQDRSSGARLRATRFPAQSTFGRERSVHSDVAVVVIAA